MSDYFSDPKTIRARKARRCIYCAESINVGDTYIRSSGVFEGDWFTNHFHPECFDDLRESDDREFTPYSNERPQAFAD